MLQLHRFDFNCRSWIYPLFVFLLVLVCQSASAQQINLSIKQTIQKVQDNLPQLEALRQEALAVEQNVELAKNTLVPDLTAGYQLNTATFNNITGMSYPGFLLPISGPPSVKNELNFVPGSAAGALIKWNPLTFGQRSAAMEKATAQFKQANAAYNGQLFQYQYDAINTYLDAVYYTQLIKSLQAAVDRNNAELGQSLVLAKNGLRPGIDTAQFQSAIVQAEIDLLQTERAYQQKLIELTRLTAMDSAAENILLTDTLIGIPAGITADTISYIASHPYYQAVESHKNTTVAALKEIQRSWIPQLDIWGNIYARGSGIDAMGEINKRDGFNLSRTNVGVGLQLSFPILQFSKVSIQKKQYQSLLKADGARLEQVQLDIGKQTSAALSQYFQDMKIAAKSPTLLKAANDVYKGLKLGYESGLIDYTRLAQAQYDLVKAEVNDANARLQLWRSILAVAIAKGNLNLFTDQLK
ncbi:MAG TPA: TolC family protein [Agriterribacter sp.]|nr:TolC family protein [Agriterribacter sp.]